MSIALLPPTDDPVDFPDPGAAERDPDGLLAVGGRLEPQWLLHAYRHGIFPWFGEGDPILWWSPDPRCVLFPERLHRSRSLCRTLRRGHFRITRDRAFERVIRACAEPRADSPGTWIVPPMIAAYVELHARGHARSFECWHDERLVGGIYGVHIGRVFFGESMFSRMPDASKVAMVACAEAADIDLIDCQIPNPHLERMGAEPMARIHFLRLLREYGVIPG